MQRDKPEKLPHSTGVQQVDKLIADYMNIPPNSNGEKAKLEQIANTLVAYNKQESNNNNNNNK